MVKAKAYKDFWDAVAVRFPEITKVKVVVDESQLQRYTAKLSKNDIILLAVIPSFDTDAPDLDNMDMSSSCYVFLLRRFNTQNNTEDEWITDVDTIHDLTTRLIDELVRIAHDFDNQDANTLLIRTLNPDKMHADPEYNYMGCNGWSLSFNIKRPRK